MSGITSFIKRRTLITLAFVILAVSLTVGSIALTQAQYKETAPSPVVNDIKPGDVEGTIEETPSGNAKTEVKVKNTGNVYEYVKLTYTVNWINSDGSVYGKSIPQAGIDYTVSYNFSTTGWGRASDGIFYYKTAIAPNSTTASLIRELKPVSGKTPTGCRLDVKIIAEVIQSMPTTVVTSRWASGVSSVNSGRLVLK